MYARTRDTHYHNHHIVRRRPIQQINELARKIEQDLEVKLTKKFNEKIEKEIKPQIREEVREEYEAEIEALEEQIESYENQLEMFGAQNCTGLKRMACVKEQRQILILYLIANGWITDKKIMNSDFWHGKPITRKPRGGITIHP